MKEIIEIYPVGSEVYAISDYLKDGKSTHHVAIFPAIVTDVWVSDDITYSLSTPAGAEWGDVVNEKDVSDDFYYLVEKMKVIWRKNANTF